MSRVQRILVAYADPMIRMLIACMLTDAGFAVDEAEDGYAALECMAKSAYELILLDLQMPVMDGCTFLERYARQREHRAPVIACSARAAGDPTIEGLPVEGFLPKPFKLRELYAAVEHCTVCNGRIGSGVSTR